MLLLSSFDFQEESYTRTDLILLFWVVMDNSLIIRKFIFKHVRISAEEMPLKRNHLIV